MKKRSIAAIAMCVFSLFGLTAHAGVDVGDGNYIVFYHHDVLGSPTVVTDHNGNSLWHEHNDPYGRTRDRVVPSGNEFLSTDKTGDRLGYTGHTSDVGTGLVYMKARFYDPVIGRFYSNDPVGFTVDNPMMFNRYAYANNNPYIYVDPDGREVFLHTHHVAFGLDHAKLTIVPDNQSAYANDSRFNNVLKDGRRYATVGAGPVDGKLVSDVNRKKDVVQKKNKFEELVADSKVRNEDDLIREIFAAEGAFKDQLDYDFFPGIQDGYNSNSFISGLMDFLGITTQNDPDDVPGFSKPVPSNEYTP